MMKIGNEHEKVNWTELSRQKPRTGLCGDMIHIHIATISLYSLPERVNTQTFLYILFFEVIFNLILKLFIEKDSKNTFRYYFKCTHRVNFLNLSNE